ncbi:MAG: hypothetical protein HMLKMBBP_01257 [Planctomycetes bacterium]|nr:hypothetical protein [Planctomycetota bacterium]
MGWRPSRDPALFQPASSQLWHAVSGAFDEATSLADVRRLDAHRFDPRYITNRRGGDLTQLPALRSRLPTAFRDKQLGEAEIDVISFILTQSGNRVLSIVGPRGAGKTSLMNYVDWVMTVSLGDEAPLILRIDHNATARGTSATIEDTLELVRARLDLESAGRRAEIVAQARTVMKQYEGMDCVARLARALRERAPSGDPRKILFWFDSLDHVASDTVETALSIAGAMYRAAGIGSVLCMRPGSFGNALGRGSAMHFVTWKIEVQAPSFSDWFERTALLTAEKAATASLVAYDQPLSREAVLIAFQRLRSLMSRRGDEKEDVFALLEAASANNVRHMLVLFRRLLSHRSLPGEFLLGVTDAAEFHPLVAIVEGERGTLIGDDHVPNLLALDGAAGEFLLYHRILALVAARRYASTKDLLSWLQVLGFQASVARQALVRLQTAELLVGSDVEFVLDDDPLPSAYILTEAGYCYLNRMLCDPDYLLSAVLDVPLRHRRIRNSPRVGFLGQLDSLLEYAAEVVEREESQVALLAKRAADHPRCARRIADVLDRDGTLSALISRAFDRLYFRMRGSRDAQVFAYVDTMHATSTRIRKRGEALELRLRNLRSSGREDARYLPVTFDDAAVNISLRYDFMGETLAGRVDVRSSTQLSAVATMFSMQKSAGREDGYAQALLAHRGEQFSGSERGSKHVSGSLTEMPHPGDSELRSVAVSYLPVEASDDFAVISVEQAGDVVRLAVHARALNGYSPEILTNDLRVDDVRRMAREWVGGVTKRMLAGKPIGETVRAAGVAMAKRVLTNSGHRTLSNLRGMVRRVVLFTQVQDVPWEWLCPQVPYVDERASLSEMWDVVRWTGNGVHGALRLRFESSRPAAGGVVTVGRQGESAPASMEELRQRAASCGVLHLVGHQDRGGLQLGGEDALVVSRDLLDAYPLLGPSHVVVSACGAASGDQIDNIPSTISLGSGARAWGPIAPITASDAIVLDDHLRSVVRTGEAVDASAVMSGPGSRDDVRALYVSYGLHRPREGQS